MNSGSAIGVNVDLLLIKDGKVLLGRWNPEYCEGKEIWGVPGKDLRFGETFSQAAERNLREEFDVGMKSCEVIGVNANRAFGRHYVDVAMTVEPDGEIDLTVRTLEWSEWKWFPLDALPAGLFDAAKAAIACWQQKKICAAE